jgi:hypothetical protein
MNDSDLIQSPFFGPEDPLYPQLPQVVRTTGSALAGTNVYPCFTEQFTGNIAIPFRDREPAYVLEPNGIILSPAYYDCRLVGSYLNLPLYVTSCCVTGSSSSSR